MVHWRILEVAVRPPVRLMLGLIAVLTAVPALAGQIGFLDMERAILTVQEGKSQLQLLENWATSRRATIDQLQQRITELDQRLASQRNVASAEERGDLERELLQAQRQLEDEQRSFNRERIARRDKMLGDIGVKIGSVAGEYAEANGFDVVFLLAGQPIAWYSKDLDITDIVIRLYDERFPVN
jgi:Skp family chaperone for outer membrane proteins